MLSAVVVSNAIHGLERTFQSNRAVQYRFAPITEDFGLDLTDADVLIVPNGSDHVAMLKVKDQVRRFLDAGGTLLCFDGWFTDWIPGNRWIHDNSKKTIDVRYAVRTDRHGLFDGVDLDDLQFNHGISGWWACGYIEPADGADVVLEDTWERPMIVLDETTTAGQMVVTASGPLGDFGDTTEDGSFTLGDLPASDDTSGLVALYRNILSYAAARRPQVAE